MEPSVPEIVVAVLDGESHYFVRGGKAKGKGQARHLLYR